VTENEVLGDFEGTKDTIATLHLDSECTVIAVELR
jgi:hypothetical protein